MERKICLDSDILVDLSRDINQIENRLSSFNAVFYITSINAFEIWMGRKNKEDTKDFLEIFDILNFNLDSALLSADILRSLNDTGMTLEFRDIFIAAICIVNNTELMTNNLKHFERLKKFGLKLVS